MRLWARTMVLGLAAAVLVPLACTNAKQAWSSSGGTGAAPDASTRDAAGAGLPDGSASVGAGGDAGPDAPAGLWDPVPNIDQLPSCVGGALLHDASTWPKPAWQPCGVGCQVASPLDADSVVALGEDGSSAASYGADLYYQTQSSSAQSTYNILRRLSDDSALVVLRVPQMCYAASSDAAAPFVFQFLDGKDAATRWMGHYALGPSAFLPPPSSYQVSGPQDSWFSWDTGVGTLGKTGAVNVLLTGKTQLQTIYQAQAMANNARARNGLVAWVDWATTPTTIRAWTEQGGAIPLFQAPQNAAGIALSDQAIAFLGVTGLNVVDGGYDTGKVYWTPFATTSSGIQIHAGPDVTGQVGGPMRSLSTGGDYIALPRQAGHVLAQDLLGILVVQMSTGKLWTLKPRPNMYMTVAGISPTVLLAFESDFSYAAKHGSSPFQRWLRLDLTKLDQLVTTLPAGM